ncbi:MAG: PEP-CTERM sorting domain-containing protein [Burkholderiales bacterium]|nr:PEP-CTERM sorting domain-containing protein [Burkholderiales bacterium]
MRHHFFSKSALGLAVAICTSHAALASTITFDGLPGITADPFNSYSESGFTVAATFGNWKEGHSSGAPLPSLYVHDLHSSPFGALQVTNGGLFTFDSFDLSAFMSAVGYEIKGWLGTTSVFDVASSQAAGTAFTTVSGGSSLAIDRLTIDISSGGPGEFNVDNIRVSAVSAVPEPSTYGLMMLGFGFIGAITRRRQRG